jgi:hypothetical protein
VVAIESGAAAGPPLGAVTAAIALPVCCAPSKITK